MDPRPLPLSPWQRLGVAIITRPRRVVAVVLVMAALAGALAGARLRVRPGYVDLLDERSPLQRRYLELLDRFGNVETLHVIVEGPEDERLEQFITGFSRRVMAARDAQGQRLAARVLDRVDGDWFVERLPALLPDENLEALASVDNGLDLPGLVSDPSAARILDTIRGSVDRAATSGPRDIDPAELAALSSLLDGLAAAAGGESVPTSRWLLQQGGQQSERLDAYGHVRIDAGRVLVSIAPADTSNNYQAIAPFLEAVRQAAAEAKRESGASVQLSYTGAPALIVDEMKAVSRDVALAAVLSVLLVTLLFFVSFQSLRHVLFAGIANVAGLSLTFGAAWLLVGYLNLFSAVFAAVLAGLGIDFGIHILNSYEAHRREGMAARDALLEVFRSAVPAIAASAVTTAAAFLAILTSEFKGFAQLGLISGVGVLVCVTMSITLVPALLAWDSKRRSEPERPSAPWSERLLLAIPQRAGSIAIVGGVLTLVALLGLARARFDHDLMNLQPEGSEAVRLQHAEERRVSTHHAFSVAHDLADAADRTRRFSALPSVAQAASAASFLPLPSERRQELLGLLAARVATIRAPATGPIDLLATKEATDALLARLQELQDLAFEGGDARAVEALEALMVSARSLRAALATPAIASAGLTDLRMRLSSDFIVMAAALPRLAKAPLGPADLPPALASHFVGKDGTLAVIVEPKNSVWDRPALAKFVAELRSVDKEITGPPIQVLEITEMMRVSLVRAAWIAFGAIVLLVALSMRSVAGSALALLPLLLGFTLMLGLMGWLNVPLNPANLVALPLLLGIGVDGGVHVAHRWLEVRDATRTLKDVGHALLITSLTTVAGFLPLLLARHRGIRSLGVVTCLGSLTMLLSAVVLVPALLALLDRMRPLPSTR